MKRFLVLLLVLAPCLPLAAIDFGAGADMSLTIDTYTEDTFKASASDIELMPAVVMRLSPQLELRPYAVLGFQRQSDPDSITFAVADDLSSSYFGAGAGLFYAFIQKDPLALLIGPNLEAVIYTEPSGASATAYQRYFEMELTLSLPIYLDVKLKDKLYLRTGVEIPGLSYDYTSYQLGGVTTGTGSFAFQDYWASYLVPYFGFYLMF
jgi:hypothetical protein